jgi:hypothetical protein
MGPGIDRSWETLSDSAVVTVRWPSSCRERRREHWAGRAGSLVFGADECTPAADGDYKPFISQDGYCHAHRPARYSLFLLEIALTGQRGALLQLARLDHVPKDVRKLGIERGWVHVINVVHETDRIWAGRTDNMSGMSNLG